MKARKEIQERLDQIETTLLGSYSALTGADSDEAVAYVIRELEAEKDTLEWVLKA